MFNERWEVHDRCSWMQYSQMMQSLYIECYQPHLSWVERVFNQIYRFKSQMVVELVLHEACMLAYVSEDFSFSDPGREAWIAVPFSVAKLAQTTAIRTA